MMVFPIYDYVSESYTISFILLIYVHVYFDVFLDTWTILKINMFVLKM